MARHSDSRPSSSDDSEAPPPATERVRKYAAITTFHGFNMITATDHGWVGRSFWIIIIIIVFTVVAIQLNELIRDFIAQTTFTSIKIVYPKVGMTMPPLTVCILTKLNATAVKQHYAQVSKQMAEFSTSSFFSAYSTSVMHMSFFDPADAARRSPRQRIAAPETVFTCHEQFLLCWFENGIIRFCCDNSTENPFKIRRHLLHSGPCYTFEAPEDKGQRLPGPVGGLGFVYWYPNNHVLRTAFNSYDEHALHLFMSPADAMLEKNPITLPVGYHSHISLSAVHSKRLDHDQLGRMICEHPPLKYFEKYSYEKCQVEVLIDNLLDQCGCMGVTTYGQIPQEKLCSPLNALNCFEKLAKNFSEMLVASRNEKCEEACDYWTYRASLTVGKVFNPAVEAEMLKSWRMPDGGKPADALIIADVYFGEMQYTEIEEKPAVSVESFISNIGGALGLWTGASIITWIHLVYFCTVSFFKKKRKRRAAARARWATAMATRDPSLVKLGGDGGGQMATPIKHPQIYCCPPKTSVNGQEEQKLGVT